MRIALLLLLVSSPVLAVPVIPNFSQGLVTSVTESKSVVKENIVSESYRTGFEYSVSGVGVQPSSGVVSPPSSGNALNFANRSNWVQTTPGNAFQYAETYSTPGLIERVTIDRETITESVVNSTSTFAQ